MRVSVKEKEEFMFLNRSWSLQKRAACDGVRKWPKPVALMVLVPV